MPLLSLMFGGRYAGLLALLLVLFPRDARGEPSHQERVRVSGEVRSCFDFAEGVKSIVSSRSSIVSLELEARAPNAEHQVVLRTTDQPSPPLLVLTFDGAERTLQAPTCEALADAVALVILVALDPGALARTMPMEPAGDASLDSPAKKKPDAPAPPPEGPRLPTQGTTVPTGETRRPSSALAWYIAFGGELLAAPMRDPSLGGTLGLGAQHSRSVDLRGAVSFTTTRAFAAGSLAAFDLLVLRADACAWGLRPAPPFLIRPCIGIGGGALRGEGLAVAHGNVALAPWVDARAGLRVRASVGRHAWTLDGGALVPVTRPSYVFDRPRIAVHEIPGVAAWLSLGFEWSISSNETVGEGIHE